MQVAAFDIDRLGKRILERLEVLGINQAEAARRAGVSRSWLTDLLTGRKRTVRADNLTAMARALLTSRSYLLGETGDPTPAEADNAQQFAPLLPEILSAPAIGRQLAPQADFVEPALRNKGLLYRPHIAQHSKPFFTSKMQQGFERYWNETLGSDPHPRLPLFSDPVPDIAGAVQLGPGLPRATASIPVLGAGSGNYAIALPDDSMEPAASMGWIAYVHPGPSRFGTLVAVRVKASGQGAMIMVRRLLDMNDATVIVGTLTPPTAHAIDVKMVLSVHPVAALSLDPFIHGPGSDERLLRDEWLAQFAEE